jgi:hypothetical protein
MSEKQINRGLFFIFLCIAGIPFISFLTSCGKANTTLPAGSGVQLQVLNLSPDLLPVDLYIDVVKKNASPFTYPIPSGYFSLASVDTPFQIRSSLITGVNNNNTINILSIDSILRNNLKYTLFITGLRANNSITYIFTTDSSSAPVAGRAKVRFVNASPGSPSVDVTANGTMAFPAQAYKNISKFIQVPPGNYDFKVMPSGSTTTILADLPAITVQDGKLYTLYAYGIAGRPATDTAAFKTAIIPNQ